MGVFGFWHPLESQTSGLSFLAKTPWFAHDLATCHFGGPTENLFPLIPAYGRSGAMILGLLQGTGYSYNKAMHNRRLLSGYIIP